MAVLTQERGAQDTVEKVVVVEGHVLEASVLSSPSHGCMGTH